MRMREILTLIEASGQVVDLRKRLPSERLKACVYIGKSKVVLFDDGAEHWSAIEQKFGPSAVQTSYEYIRLWDNCISIVGTRKKWQPAHRSRYSKDVVDIARRLLSVNIVQNSTPVVLAEYGSDGQNVGTIEQLLAPQTQAKPLHLFHGTTLGRAQQILSQGLHPVSATGRRQWKRDYEDMHAHRDEAVYLTSSPQLAAIYATRAVTNAKKHKEKGQKPVVLRVTILPEQFDSLRPDDDFLVSMARHDKSAPWRGEDPYSASLRGSTDRGWQASLDHEGQIALIGSVPASQISLTTYQVRGREAYGDTEIVEGALPAGLTNVIAESSSKYLRSATLKDGTTITLDLARWQPDLDRFPDESQTPVFLARALLDGKMIGFAEFYAYDRKTGSVEQVEVNQEFRRKGVATALYDYLEGLGLTVEPTSSRMEPDGRAFWSNRSRRALDEAFPSGLTNGGATNIQTLHNLDPEHAEADERLRLHHGPQDEPDDAYDAMDRYTELSGRFTRGLIAGGLKKGPTTGFTAADVKNLKSVDSYVGRARPLAHELTVYSGLGFLPEGDTFVSPAFLSTSIDPARAAAHANDRRRHRKADFDVIARFHLPEGYTGGRYLGRFSRYRGEAEFLLARGQTFNIIGRHTVQVADGDTVITRHIIDMAPAI